MTWPCVINCHFGSDHTSCNLSCHPNFTSDCRSLHTSISTLSFTSERLCRGGGSSVMVVHSARGGRPRIKPFTGCYFSLPSSDLGRAHPYYHWVTISSYMTNPFAKDFSDDWHKWPQLSTKNNTQILVWGL